MKGLICVLWLLAMPAQAQKPVAAIDVLPQVPEYTIAKVEVTSEMPEMFKVIDVLWDVSDKLDVLPMSDTLMYFTGPPGTYLLQFDAVVVQEMSFPDGEGNTVTINNYKFRIREKATVTIGKIGPAPPPEPPDPPEPPEPPDPEPSGKYQIMMLYHYADKERMSLQQLAVLNSQSLKDILERAGHTLVERLDIGNIGTPPVSYKPFLDEAAGKATPCVILRDKTTGEMFHLPLPESPEKLIEWLQNPATMRVAELVEYLKSTRRAA